MITAEVRTLSAAQSRQERKGCESAVNNTAECWRNIDTACSHIIKRTKDSEFGVSVTEIDETLFSTTQVVDASGDKGRCEVGLKDAGPVERVLVDQNVEENKVKKNMETSAEELTDVGQLDMVCYTRQTEASVRSGVTTPTSFQQTWGKGRGQRWDTWRE